LKRREKWRKSGDNRRYERKGEKGIER